jgi:uncharacterized repeat protein (TIGR02543 family)
MKKSIFKVISGIICTVFLMLLTPIVPSQVSQALTADNYQYVVTFDSQGGSTVINKSANYNSIITTPIKPTKAGYTFVGWYKEAGTINAWNFTIDKVTANTTLYAKWIVAIPAAPTGVTATSSSYNSINISWTGVTGASGYAIYRATSSAGTYTLISTTPTTRYNNTGLKTNSTYYYKVKAYRLASNIKVYSGFSTTKSAKPRLNTPTSVKAVASSNTSIKISWSEVTGVNGYGVYRATSSSGTYTLISTTTATRYNNTGLKTKSTYYYRVRAYRLVSTVKVYSSYSTTKRAKSFIYTYGNTSGNLTNGGQVVSDGQYTYYRNSSDEYKLYKSKPDGTSKSKISDSVCSSLNIVGEWIYYSVEMVNPGIYKMKKDGSSKTTIVNYRTKGIAVVNDWIYYLEGSAPGAEDYFLYKIKTDGTSKTKINFGTGNYLTCPTPQYIVVIEDWVYLPLANKIERTEDLYRVKTDGSTAKKVLNVNPRFFSIEDGWIYYADEAYSKIKKIKVDGSCEKVLYTIPDSHYSLDSINVSNGYVYFNNSADREPIDKLGIYRIKTDGSNLKQLLSGSARLLNIAHNWIYFRGVGSSSSTYSNGVFKTTIGGTSQILKLKIDGSQLLPVN